MPPRRPRTALATLDESDESNVTHIGPGGVETPEQTSLPVQSVLLPSEPPDLETVFVEISEIHADGRGAPPDPGLVQSIRDVGVLAPIHVQKMADGAGYWIKKGRHRWAAAQEAGVRLVPVVISGDDLSPGVVRLVLKGRQRPNVAAEFQAVESLLKTLNADDLSAYREVSRVTGLDMPTIQERIGLRALIEPLMLGLEDGRVPGGVAFKAAAQPIPIQRILADVLERNDRLTMKDVRAAQNQDAEQDSMDGEAGFKFTKWRPVVEEIVERLSPAVAAADQPDPPAAAIDDLIVAVHETIRRLNALAASKSADD